MLGHRSAGGETLLHNAAGGGAPPGPRTRASLLWGRLPGRPQMREWHALDGVAVGWGRGWIRSRLVAAAPPRAAVLPPRGAR